MALARTPDVKYEPSEPTLQPNMAERAMDTAADVSRTIGGASANLKAAVERHLRAHPQVASSRMGELREGGRGVTVARLR